jgi:hypothetical protein
MTKHRAILKAIPAAILICTSGFAAAAATDQQDITVTATVATVCKFTTGSAITVPFGSINPSDTGNKTQPVSVPYKCTSGTAAPGITVTGALEMVSGANTLAFTLGAWTTAAGTGFAGAALNATNTVTIAEAAYQAAPAGVYSGTITLDIDN